MVEENLENRKGKGVVMTWRHGQKRLWFVREPKQGKEILRLEIAKREEQLREDDKNIREFRKIKIATETYVYGGVEL